MRAMRLQRPGTALALVEGIERPAPGPHQVLLRVAACGVCRTDLHIVDGELTEPKLPLVPGHEIVGYVVSLGEGVTDLAPGERVGVPWLGFTCGHCAYCRSGRENLCDRSALHRLSDRWRLRRLRARRCALLLPAAAGVRRRRRGAAALRRAHRLSRLAACRRRPSASASTASARRRISSRRWRAIAASASSPSPGAGDRAGQEFAR